ncbi:GntR family transcriptional regulator [Cereibacter azotoformans]|uniref:GntR family transcriptional regulator n=2 Tax=Cereibacter TaxID=1653176 RepID=A0A2T5K682_9RHOB|nr:GntR family transcriptional regulator [Cereibacter azotoformans]AXQ95813.1 GntR family transcriptional regulator [Cereibacter sphaeroides]PTR17933.1 GntR family transcriptional regulator [Cereibacter azotoformans]UIJ32676.1 GntR family transcriptional regulator [Cereibacter azotoformans]ULB11410.1 GntR family transcriptional regulator [Cereibacter azotoformans]
MSELHIQRLPAQAPSLTGQVYDAICRMLLDSTLKPDSRTSIRELADELGVSTMPVREAVGRLVAQGALSVRKNRAVEVPRMTEDEFRELTRTRLLLECEAARLAVERMVPDEVAGIRALHAQFRDEMGSGNRSAALMTNRLLHFALYDAARSPTMRQMIGMAWLRAGPLISLDIGARTGGSRAEHSIVAHGQLVAALESRDAEAAAEAIRSDIAVAAATILDQRAYFHRKETRDGSGA